MVSERPVVLAYPYLPLRDAVEFSGWWLGPLEEYEGPWLKTALRQGWGVQTAAGGAIDTPSLLARADEGVNGESPGSTEQQAVAQAIAWATRNDVVHALAAPTMTYEEPGSPYAGPLVETADRLVREAIGVGLGA